ncbi:MAG TPA: S1 RNA-binding domain-containing protein [Longilinea sp.]|nr:S1 RNA-binding domain-containing protein [Longilinea sp.]
MVNNKVPPPDNGADPTDEGWWASVLTEEESTTPTSIPEPTRTDNAPQLAAQSSSPDDVDWNHIQDLFENDEVVDLLVYGYNRGGLLVEGDHIQGFVPISHIINAPADPNREEGRRDLLTSYVGKKIHVKVIECEPTQDRVVFSERAALAGEGKRKELFHQLAPNTVISGTVTNVTEFGAFVDLGGVEGLIHVSELSWGRVQHPNEVIQVGQTIDVLVMQLSEENSRIALSLKRLTPNPWEVVSANYKAGDITVATITSIMKFGAFARLKEGIEGLIHVSSIMFPPNVHEVKDLLSEGEEVRVVILHLEAERRRLGLGLAPVE